MKRGFAAILAASMALARGIGIPVMADAADMNEKEFFSRLDYERYPALAGVRDAAGRGDYAAAKSELLSYYRQRKAEGGARAFPITENDRNPGMAELALYNILTGPYEFDVKIGEFTVSGKGAAGAKYYTADITERAAAEAVNGNLSIMLMQKEKQEYAVSVKTKEGGAAPVLRVETTDGAKFDIKADNDTYIHAGTPDRAYGRDRVMCVNEYSADSDNAISGRTRRAYINFPLDVLDGREIKSAVLRVSAYLDGNCVTGDKDVIIIGIGDTTWSEDTLKWSGVGGSVYSWQDNPTGPPWNLPKNADNEYLNVTSRFWFGPPMAYEYLQYIKNPDEYPMGEQYGEKLLFLMNAFAEKKSYGFNRTLETGERLNRWVDIIDALVDTPAMTPDIFYNLISFVWGDCNFINGLDIENGSYWWSNWRIVANAGFFKGTEYFPEFTDYAEFRKKAESNVEYCMDLLYNEDMSFTEAGMAYAQWCAELFSDCVRMAELNGRPMSAEFKERLRYAARFAMESFYPDGYDTNIGDSNYVDKKASFAALAELLDDAALKAYVSGGKTGDAGYLSSWYGDCGSAFMRNSWDPNETVYVSFINSPNDGHAHPDSNQLLMYAYGRPLLVDSGRYSYSSYNSIFSMLRTARAHNTIEAAGKTLGTHSEAAAPAAYHVSNKLFEFNSFVQNGYEGTAHTRNVLYLYDGYAIVSDYVDGETADEYRQNWHFMPASRAYADGDAARTAFRSGANITIVNAGGAAEIKDGYHSANYGLVADSKYASYARKGRTVKFDTVLYPTRSGTAELKAYELAPGDVSKSAIRLEGAVDGIYYVKNTDKSDGVITNGTDSFATDAKLMYYSGGTTILCGGSMLSLNDERILEYSGEIPGIAVTVRDGAMYIYIGKTDTTNKSGGIIKIKNDGIDKVYINDAPAKTDVSDGYITVRYD